MSKVKGYTLVETLLSLTIIVLSIGIGFMVFENFMNSTSSYKIMKGRDMIDNKIFQRNFESEYFEDTEEEIEVEIVESEEWPGCELVEIKYYDRSGKICTQSLYLKK